jgi:7-carboxy-7-deazaguanine synthase
MRKADPLFPVNELFVTIQGEATHTGRPSTFIRFQSCPVGCPWCDTKHTWDVLKENAVTTEVMVAKVDAAKTFAYLTAAELVTEVREREARHVVLTGGEPCMYDLTELTTDLIAEGYTVQIETSGLFAIRCDPKVWVTVSPKIDMPGGYKMRADSMERANEVKYPVGKWADVEKLHLLMRDFGVTADRVWLQPLSQSDKATALCVEAATTMGARVSLQTHKYANMR